MCLGIAVAPPHLLQNQQLVEKWSPASISYKRYTKITPHKIRCWHMEFANIILNAVCYSYVSTLG